ncbi:MAG: hypothetical protein KME17_06625 [Cyanosarcina radialis HA8281-LM2]|jgi:hypothetical protein|nr:hypothetical protein [Cyanosarcina radialis HA8281-LM2]
MKFTPALLGITLAATALSVNLANPAQATTYQRNTSSHTTVKTYKIKKVCHFKRVYVRGYYDAHGYFHPGFWTTKKFCKTFRVLH